MKIVWENLNVSEFNKICRVCLANRELEPLAEEEKSALIKLTPWVAQLQTSAFFPNKICADCSKQLQLVNEFLNRCNTLANSFTKCIQDYKERVSKDNGLPTLEVIFLTTEVPIKQEVEEIDDESDEDATMPFTEVFVDDIKKEKRDIMEFEDTAFIPQQTTSNSADSSSLFDPAEFIESTSTIPGLNDSEESESDCAPEHIKTAAKKVLLNLLPEKSKDRYEKEYVLFIKWCETNNAGTRYTEDVLIAYISEMSVTKKPSTMWAIYSMLKTTLSAKHNVDISKYTRLKGFLKKQAKCYSPKKHKVLKREEIRKFLADAPDERYLMLKVALIFGVSGACARDELTKMMVDDIEDDGTIVVIKIANHKTGSKRAFIVSDGLEQENNYLSYYRKYAALRPATATTKRFFLRYENGKCTNQPVGMNTFGNMPKRIAEFLCLPDYSAYTGHCFRRSSATLLADAVQNNRTPLAPHFLSEAFLAVTARGRNIKPEKNHT